MVAAKDESLYEVIATSPRQPGATEPEPAPLPTGRNGAEDLSSLTVLQLRGRARDAGHSGFSRYTKAQLLALLSS